VTQEAAVSDHIPSWEPPVHSAEVLDSHAVLPVDAEGTGSIGSADEPRSRSRVVIASALGALLVLGGGAAAAAVVVLHRPDVQLMRAFDATRSAPQGSMSLSVQADAAALATVPTDAATSLQSTSIRYAWSPATQQISVTYDGKKLGTITTTDTHVTVQIDPKAIPGADATSGITAVADSLGADGQVLRDLAAGKPIGLTVGPGSAIQKLIDKAAAGGSGSAAPQLSPTQTAAVLDAITKSVTGNTTVTSVGSDADGDHYLASVALKDVADTAWTQLSTLMGGLGSQALAGGALTKPDLSTLATAHLDVDVWVTDGRVSRVEIPLAALVRQLDPKSEVPGSISIVAVLSTDGVTPPDGPVTEVPESLITKLASGGLTGAAG
jgi:hypothetical protein